MRLQRLDLDFFGHFTAKSLDFGPPPDGTSDFHVIYGLNEAGKTTLMEGYLRLLYGFRHQEPYDFKHKRPNLRISAALCLDGEQRDVTRLPGRTGNLVDTSGTPLPETALQAPLAGLSIEDYRKLLCLDDATLEQGGEEIANSKGDIGRLLFSAAAGVSDLSEVLEHAQTRASGLYRPRSSKSAHARLKRHHDALTAQIRAADISVSVYRQRSDALASALTVEHTTRAARRDALHAQARLDAQAKALPMLAKLSTLERDLVLVQHYPKELDIDAETLNALARRRSLLAQDQQRLSHEIASKTSDLEAIVTRPDLVPFQVRLKDLRALREKCGAAVTDLPGRKRQRAAVLDEMRRLLADIGLNDQSDPTHYVLDTGSLQALETAYQAFGRAVESHATAQTEHDAALHEHDAAQSALDDIPMASGDVQALLDRFDAAHLVPELTKAHEALRLAERAAQDAQALIALDGRRFDPVPAPPLSASEAQALARDTQTAQTAIARADDDLAEAEASAQAIRARLDVLQSPGALLDDAGAQAARSTRDRLWRAHLVDLARASAQTFEAAMRLDDTTGAARLAQAKDLAELRQTRAALAEADSRASSRRQARDAANQRAEALHDTLQAHLGAAGLTADISALTFADWVVNCEAARARARDADSARLDAAPVLKAAEGLGAALAQALDETGAPLAILVARATRLAEQHRSAQTAYDRAHKAQAAREAASTTARDALDHAQDAWIRLRDAAFGATAATLPFPQTFETMRRVLVLNTELHGFARQITGMQTDQAALDAALAPLLAQTPDLAGMPRTQAFDALTDQVEEARRAEEMLSGLTQEIETARKAHTAAQHEIADIDTQVAQAAALFGSEIHTGDVDAVRQAVMTATRANALRAAQSDLTTECCTLLGVATRAEAWTALEGRTLTDIETAAQEGAQDLRMLDEQLTRAIEARTHAQSDVDAVQGDGDVAMLVAQRQTTQLEMEQVIFEALDLRLGHMLADAAIRRYRDTHRSAMMNAAETAFAELTDGTYKGLTSQIDGGTETLVAIRASDGAAKEAHAMSKGTRFQLYLALRAAAYAQLAANGTVLPFFCDDIFETFDEVRTRAACRVMRRIGLTGQAIYLTHHAHVVDIAREVCGDEVRVHNL